VNFCVRGEGGEDALMGTSNNDDFFVGSIAGAAGR
jgi:hypothetical protein